MSSYSPSSNSPNLIPSLPPSSPQSKFFSPPPNALPPPLAPLSTQPHHHRPHPRLLGFTFYAVHAPSLPEHHQSNLAAFNRMAPPPSPPAVCARLAAAEVSFTLPISPSSIYAPHRLMSCHQTPVTFGSRAAAALHADMAATLGLRVRHVHISVLVSASVFACVAANVAKPLFCEPVHHGLS